MAIQIAEEQVTRETLEVYGRTSIAFTVTARLAVEVAESGLGGLRLIEESVEQPWTKNYDEEDGAPVRWAERWDTSRWCLLAAFEDGIRIGGAVLALDTPGMWFLRGRQDIAALWDLRVDPEYRRRGVGRALFASAAEWAERQSCRWLKIETQNINVAACRFYAAMGARLGSLDRFAYPNLPDEVELDWYLDLQA